MTELVADRILLTVEEAARQLSIGRTKAYELISTGDLPSIRIGRAVRVSLSDLREWVNTKR